MRRCLWLILLMLCLACAACCGHCGTQRISADHFYDESGTLITPFTGGVMTFTMAYRKGANDMWLAQDKPLIQRIERELHLRFEITEIEESQWEERIDIMFASGNIPDVIWGPVKNLAAYTDNCLDITDMLESYTRNVFQFLNENPTYLVGEQIGERLYAIPSVIQSDNRAYNFNLAINQWWLYRLKLQMPRTIEELTDVLRAFVREDANGNGIADEKGFSFIGGYGVSSTAQTLDYLRCLFGLVNDGENEALHDVMVVDGVVRYVPMMDEYRDMLEWLHLCYDEGLMDRDSFIQGSVDLLQKGMKGQLGLVFGGNDISSSVGSMLEDQYVYMLPTPNSGGKAVVPTQQTPAIFTRHSFIITTQCRYPEYLLAMVEWMNSSEPQKISVSFGEGGLANDQVCYNPDGTTDCCWQYFARNGEEKVFINQLNYPHDRLYPDYASWRASVTMNNAPVLIDRALYQEKIVHVGQSQREFERDAFYGKCFYDEMFPVGQISVYDTLKRNAKAAELRDYIDDFFNDAVIHGVNDAKWSAHLQALEAMGIDAWLSDYQGLYDSLMDHVE